MSTRDSRFLFVQASSELRYFCSELFKLKPFLLVNGGHFQSVAVSSEVLDCSACGSSEVSSERTSMAREEPVIKRIEVVRASKDALRRVGPTVAV